jgi:hypothetical protein
MIFINGSWIRRTVGFFMMTGLVILSSCQLKYIEYTNFKMREKVLFIKIFGRLTVNIFLLPQYASENDIILARSLVREFNDKYGTALKTGHVSSVPDDRQNSQVFYINRKNHMLNCLYSQGIVKKDYRLMFSGIFDDSTYSLIN